MSLILIIIGVVFGGFWILIEIFSWSEGGSITLYLIKDVIKKYKSINKLYQCSHSNCEKIYRHYQSKIYEKRTGRSCVCPHCERNVFRTKKIKDEKWWKVHPDCPKTSWWGYMKLISMIKKIKKNERDIKAQEFFEEYNKIKVDFSWVENLQKRNR